MTRGKRRTSRELDLHGLTREEATKAALAEIRACQAQGVSKLVLVTGIGRHSESGPVLAGHILKQVTGPWKKFVDQHVQSGPKIEVWLKSAHETEGDELGRFPPESLIRDARRDLPRDPASAARRVNHLIDRLHSRELTKVSPKDPETIRLVLDLLAEHHGLSEDSPDPRRGSRRGDRRGASRARGS